MMFLLHTAVIRIKSPQPVKTCLINVCFHFLLNALCAHGCHFETLSICTFQHFKFCILMYHLFSKNTSSVVSIFLFPQNFPTVAFPVLHQSCPHFVSLTPKLSFGEDTVPAVWYLTKISWKSKLLLLREEGMHFLRCILQGHVNVKRKNGLWSLVLVIIYLVHISLPNYTANTQGGRAFISVYFQQFKLSIYCLC